GDVRSRKEKGQSKAAFLITVMNAPTLAGIGRHGRRDGSSLTGSQAAFGASRAVLRLKPCKQGRDRAEPQYKRRSNIKGAKEAQRDPNRRGFSVLFDEAR